MIFRNNQMEKHWHGVIILLRKLFSDLMPQYPRQCLSQIPQTAKRQCHSLKYKESQANTPFYSVPSIALPNNRSKNRNENDKQSDSFDTCESDSMASTERNTVFHVRENKIKVELCKNFVEKGYCPYENRCRFAHGIEELRAKDTWGTCELYRTRKCKVFFEKHECKFGQRCNFMHENRKVGEIMSHNSRAIRQAIRINFGQICFESYASRVHCSKLMGLLQADQHIDCNI